mmetsp:Transcript_8670/g.10879  ORF Transcript_8670/g.10879 Transcript_8670/m.10879 type:complete len:232 (-) Transcript_8670:352-1047(-)
MNVKESMRGGWKWKRKRELSRPLHQSPQGSKFISKQRLLQRQLLLHLTFSVLPQHLEEDYSALPRPLQHRVEAFSDPPHQHQRLGADCLEPHPLPRHLLGAFSDPQLQRHQTEMGLDRHSHQRPHQLHQLVAAFLDPRPHQHLELLHRWLLPQPVDFLVRIQQHPLQHFHLLLRPVEVFRFLQLQQPLLRREVEGNNPEENANQKIDRKMGTVMSKHSQIMFCMFPKRLRI